MATPLPLPLSPSQHSQQPAPTQSSVEASTSTHPPSTTADKTKPTSTLTNHHDLLPRDARLIALLLAANGASDAEPAVIRILVEFAHRYTTDILSDALIYAEHARGQPSNPSGAVVNLVPSLEDVRLAVQAKQESNSIPKEFLLDLATQINSNPLPPVPEVYGIRLPPQSQRLTAPNFSIVPRSEKGAVLPPQGLAFETLRRGDDVGGMPIGGGAGADGGAEEEEEEEEEEGEGLFGSDDDEEEGEEEVPIQGQDQVPKMNGEPEEEEDDGDDDDEDDDDEDEDEEMEEVGQFESTVPGGTTGEGDGEENEDEDEDD